MGEVLLFRARVHGATSVPVVAHTFPGLEELLVQQRVVGLVSIYHDDVNAGHADLRRVEEGILHKLLLDCHLEAALLLLQLSDDVLHVLLDLVLLLNFEPVGRIRRQLRVELVLLLADQDLQVVKLRWLEVALYRRDLVRDLALIGPDLDKTIEVQRLGSEPEAVWTLQSTDAEHFAILVWCLVGR